MKLEVGMYVRTKRDGIGRIISLSIGEDDDCCFIELSNRRTGIKKHNLVKEPSHNIIDLIEVGDYVNGEKVLLVNEGNIKIGTMKDCIFFNNEKFIKSIVTKEQFESMSHKVGD